MLPSLSFFQIFRFMSMVAKSSCCCNNCRSWVSLYRRSNASPYILTVKPKKQRKKMHKLFFFCKCRVLKMKMKMKMLYRIFGASRVPLIRHRQSLVVRSRHQISSSDDSAHHSCSLTWVIVRRRSTSRFSIACIRLIEGSDIIHGIRNSWSRISSML